MEWSVVCCSESAAQHGAPTNLFVSSVLGLWALLLMETADLVSATTVVGLAPQLLVCEPQHGYRHTHTSYVVGSGVVFWLCVVIQAAGVSRAAA